MRNKIILMGMLMVLLCSATLVYGKYVYSFNNAECNKVEAQKTTKTLDKAYDQWYAKVTYQLKDAHNNGTLKISLEKAESATSERLVLNFVTNNSLFSLWYQDTSGGFEILNVVKGWEKGKPLTVSIAGNYLQVHLSNGTQVMKDYAIGKFKIDKISAFFVLGSYFEAGYVTVEVDSNITVGITTNIIDMVIPLVILAVTLGVLGKVISKLTKQR